MIVDLISFSFKNENLPEANYIIDIRFLNNPFYIDKLRDLNGLDKEVINFFENDLSTKNFIKELCEWIEQILKLNKRANKEKVTIAIGCTGGQHRSPYIIEKLASFILKEKLVSELSVYHRELKKYNANVPI